jgi:hypothetical protein
VLEILEAIDGQLFTSKILLGGTYGKYHIKNEIRGGLPAFIEFRQPFQGAKPLGTDLQSL